MDKFRLKQNSKDLSNVEEKFFMFWQLYVQWVAKGHDHSVAWKFAERNMKESFGLNNDEILAVYDLLVECSDGYKIDLSVVFQPGFSRLCTIYWPRSSKAPIVA